MSKMSKMSKCNHENSQLLFMYLYKWKGRYGIGGIKMILKLQRVSNDDISRKKKVNKFLLRDNDFTRGQYP